jgi:hypothetical protein
MKAFFYPGNVESVKEEVAEFQDAINARYQEILGSECYQRLTEASNRLLLPGSFFDDVRDVKKQLGETLHEDDPNKLLLAIEDVKVNEEGRVEQKKVKTAPAFYISDRGFERSATSEFTNRPIASYVHEFDHFVWYALQTVPLYIARNILLSQSRPRSQNMNPQEFLMQMIGENVQPNRETLERLFAHSLAYSLDDFFEHSNRILDKQVLGSIGIDVPLTWRGQPREYKYVPIPTGALAFPVGGDPFQKMDDKEVIKGAINWEEYFRPPTITPHSRNLLESLKAIKVTRMPVTQLMRWARGKK